MLQFTTKVVKVPVRILEEDEELRILKYRILDEMMLEARYLGNMAIRYAIAFRLEGIPKEIDQQSGKSVVLDTRIYRILTRKRKYLSSNMVAAINRNYALKILKKSDKDAWAGRQSLPTFRSLFVPLSHRWTKLASLEEDGQPQFIIESPFGGKWLSEELVKMLNNSHPASDEQRRLTLISTFSWKDKGAREVVRRIVSGEYLMCDSQIKKSGKNLIVHLNYKFKNLQPYQDPGKVCGVHLGVAIPVVCAVNFGAQRMNIGSGEDVWAARSKFRAERRRRQRRLGSDAPPDRWKRSEKEDRWIHTYCHALSKQVIRFCLQQGCGKIMTKTMEKPCSGGSEGVDKPLIWTPSKFHALLEYKAREAGITTVKTNARNADLRCSECGYIGKDSPKKQPEFVCLQCGRKTHADHNAARNIAHASAKPTCSGPDPDRLDILKKKLGRDPILGWGSAAGSTAGGQ
jgi:transposase